MERKSIGSFIAALRRANGMTQKDLAEKLSVSDKAVSRWERDESLPDLMLLPVIADTFHITVDELLRGERKVAAEETHETVADAARLKKQTKRVLTVQLNRLRNRNCIALGVGAIGVLAAIICNFVLSQGFAGFCVGVVCVALSAVMTYFFQQGAMQAADDEDFDEESVRWYKATVMTWAKRMTIMLSAMLSFCLPMVLAVLGNSYGYRDTFVVEGTWLLGSFMCLATLETLITFIFWDVSTKYVPLNDQKVNLQGKVLRYLCIVMVCTLISFAFVSPTEVLYERSGTVYDSVDEFVAAMEHLFLLEGGGAYIGTTVYSADGMEISTEEGFIHEIEDAKGNTVATFHLPWSIISWSCDYDAEGNIKSIRTADQNTFAVAQMRRNSICSAIALVYAAEPFIALGIYHNILRNKKKFS